MTVPHRVQLDSLAAHHVMREAAVESMLELAGARPSLDETQRFVNRCLRIAGILALAAAVVFFVAANWSVIAVFGRFALLQILLLACAVVAFIRPPPQLAGRAALFLAFIVTGALLALFGQTYQTGADVYELFLAWTLLGLPFVIAAQWSVSAAAWIAVLNTAIALYCGWQPSGGMLWAFFGGQRFEPHYLLVGACYLNLLLWWASEARRTPVVPSWVRRLILACAFMFGCWASLQAIFQSWRQFSLVGTVLLFLAGMVAVVAWARRQRDDVFAVAVVTGAFILVSTVLLGRWLANPLGGTGIAFVLAAWLIVTSTVGARLLVGMVREWRVEDAS